MGGTQLEQQLMCFFNWYKSKLLPSMSLGMNKAEVDGHLKWIWAKQGIKCCTLNHPF